MYRQLFKTFNHQEREQICPLRDSENRPNGNDFAPVLPHQLAVLRGRGFAAVLLKYQDRLK